jgi:hypothetical protein
MDRSDERKENRSGDVLGLGDITPDRPREPRNRAIDEERGRRHDRMKEGADELTSTNSESGGVRRRSGATGIDMGGAGEGTDVE